jgi:hypothetical protein
MRVTMVALLSFTACRMAPPPLAIDDYDSALRDALCAHDVRCGLFPDAATCATSLSLEHDVANGLVTYDGDAAAACVSWIRDRACSVTLAYGAPAEPACLHIFTETAADGGNCRAPIGSLAPGARCERREDCVPGTICRTGVGDPSPTCGALPAEGEPCDPTQLLACDREIDRCEAITRTCTPRACVANVCAPLSPPTEVCKLGGF